MALAPDYATSGLFYVFYTRAPTGTELFDLRVEEFRRSAANPDVADPASGRIVLEIPREKNPSGGLTAGHNGGQLQFGPDGFLYISVGDGDCCADPAGNGQNTGTLNGKLLRINPAGTMPMQYSIPADNPFAGATPGRDEIYSYGLRNPYRFSFDRLTGDLTIGDVGENAWEEVDFMPRGSGLGANFGWNCFEGNHVFSAAPPSCTSSPPANPTPPVLEYAHPTSPCCAVNGGYVIRDGALPSLLGRYIYADSFAGLGNELHTVQLAAGGSSGDSGLGVSATNVVSFGEDACAHIYVATLGGTVYRLEPTDGAFPCAPQTPPPPGTAPPTCKGIPATIIGTDGSDVRSGTPGRDVIVGLGGNDKLSGLAGNDLICGGPGKDTLKGGKGSDQLDGQEGKDILKGGPGKDKLNGGPGKDKQVQ